MMKSSVVKRSIVISGRKTSVSLEDTFWEALKEIARQRDAPVPGLVSSIELEREHYSNLSSAIRVFVLDWYRHQLDVAGTNAFSVPAQAPSARLAS
jgi:predicted DNA-binding ribbon-helix-helix protein